jgi:hypothetical protein
MIQYRLDYQPFKGSKHTQEAYVIQFSDDGYEWFDLEDEFSEQTGLLIIKSLESAKYTHFDDLRLKVEWLEPML